MRIVDVLRRRFPFPDPSVVELPEEEYAWPEVSSYTISLPPIECAGSSANLLDLGPQVLVESPSLEVAEVVSLERDLLALFYEIVDVLKPLGSPRIEGTIFVRKEQTQISRGVTKKRTRIEVFRGQDKLNPRTPKGLDIFDMLLPVLMPPAATEFSEELFFPEELYPFQRAGVKWLFENSSALLADDMGLGKTVQAITAFRALLRRSKAIQALVICPKSVLPNWMREMERWAPELVAVRIHGNQLTRRIGWKAFNRKCHVLLTNYETVRNDIDVIRGGRFDLIIADEIQRIKNDNDTSRAVRELVSERRWGLTGTPLENRIDDVISIFAFVRKGLFSAAESPLLSVREVQSRIKPFMLRRRKEEALPQLKKMFIDTKYLELTNSQRSSYELAETQGTSRLRSNQAVTIQHVLALIQELKQICNFDPLTGESVKIEFVRDYLEDACAQDDKAIIVSQYVRTLNEVQKHIEDYRPLVYSGDLSLNERAEVERSFSEDEERRVMLLSLRAGGLGLNLTRANYLLHYDRWWNPAVEDQATARIHRIGQLKDVFVTRLICEDTIEQRIENLLEQKKILFAQVIDELVDVKLEKVLSEEELFGLFGLKPPQHKKPAAQVESAGVKAGVSMPAVAPAPSDRQKSAVIRPEKPYSNVVSMRQILRSSEEYIWWADMHFDVRAFEELIVIADPSLIQDIRILSGPANVSRRSKKEFRRFRQELRNKGITCQWRVLSRFAHDRFLMSKTYCLNVPPVNSWFQGSYSEVLETPNRPPFHEWWSQGIPIEHLDISD